MTDDHSEWIPLLPFLHPDGNGGILCAPLELVYQHAGLKPEDVRARLQRLSDASGRRITIAEYVPMTADQKRRKRRVDYGPRKGWRK